MVLENLKSRTPFLVTLDSFGRAEDRGLLRVLEWTEMFPFDFRRIFLVSSVPEGVTRGDHAHHELMEILICVSGSVEVTTDNGIYREKFCLNRPDQGLVIPPLVWTAQSKFSRHARLLVLCDQNYKESDYITDYQEFLNLIKEPSSHG